MKYENLVERLTNTASATAASSFLSNSTLSSLQSSSIFANLSNQSDPYKEDLEGFHNSKGEE
jgi:hypothetical protein